MVKMKYKNLLTLGIIPEELEHLKQGMPLNIKLDDVGLKGQVLVIFVGPSNEKLHEAAKEVQNQLERGSSQLALPGGKILLS